MTNTAAVQLGAYIGYPISGDSATTAAAQAEFNSFTAAMGQAPTVLDEYCDYTQPETNWVGQMSWLAGSLAGSAFTSAASGIIPDIGIPMASSANGETADQSFQKIISGTEDSIFNGIFQDWANDGYKTFSIRPGWEMNGTWYPWAVNSGNVADFTAAFQHIASLAHNFSAANIQVIWCPSDGDSGGGVSPAQLYPGSSYVDQIGIDTYGNPIGGDVPNGSPSSPNDYTLATAINMAEANHKPLSIPETGGLDTTYAAELGSVVANAETNGGLKVASVNIWDVPGGASGGTLEWSNNATYSAAWKNAFGEITAASNLPTPTPTPAPTPAPTPTDTLTLFISEDAWKGDAQFVVQVDGKQVGGTLTASALHATGDSNVFNLAGNWGPGSHDVRIQFINDAYGGTPSTDRNLHINDIAYDGTTYAGTSAGLGSNGYHDFTVAGSTPKLAPPVDVLTLQVSEDAYQGDADFELTIDGKQISTPQPVTVLHSSGGWENIAFAGQFGAGTHTIGVTFTNDLYGGTPSTDRNLYVNGISLNGTHYGSGVTPLMSTGDTATYRVTTAH